MFKKDDRIFYEKLGTGTVVECVPDCEYLLVKFDKKPPFTYNTGVNPCIVKKNAIIFIAVDIEAIKFNKSNSNSDYLIANGSAILTSPLFTEVYGLNTETGNITQGTLANATPFRSIYFSSYKEYNDWYKRNIKTIEEMKERFSILSKESLDKTERSSNEVIKFCEGLKVDFCARGNFGERDRIEKLIIKIKELLEKIEKRKPNKFQSQDNNLITSGSCDTSARTEEEWYKISKKRFHIKTIDDFRKEREWTENIGRNRFPFENDAVYALKYSFQNLNPEEIKSKEMKKVASAQQKKIEAQKCVDWWEKNRGGIK